MAIKGGGFLLDNIEWIVLPIAGIVCLWLLFAKVIVPPGVQYDGRRFSPGGVDRYIERQTATLRINLSSEPRPAKVHQAELARYISQFDSPVRIDTTLWPERPASRGEDEWDGRQYGVPLPPVISDAAVGYIRAMAYLPTEEVSPGKSYSQVPTEPNDLDLVTVEAKLDVAGLYTGFYDDFTGPAVRPEWRDPCLAKPIFAAVQLQRAQKLADGGWSDWQDVPRLRIDPMRSMLEVVEHVNDLPRGGMKVRLLQYKNFAVASDILQPVAYDIGSAEEDWFVPSLHGKFLSVLREQQAQERRAELQKLKEDREKTLEDARRARRESRGTRTSTPGGLRGSSEADDVGGGTLGGGVRERVPAVRGEDTRRRKDEAKETVADVYTQLEQLLIKADTRLEERKEPLLFWSHDDTVEPGKTYKYRIRLGVFNSLAGTNKLKSSSVSYKDEVIIWSDFVEAGAVEIPLKLYFFAKDIREATSTVIVEVFRYALGYWHSREYVVESGEVIGRVDEPQGSKEGSKEAVAANVLVPQKVDFRTVAVFVDAVAVDDWAGGKSLRPRSYFDMYYSYDGADIKSTPIRQRFWPGQMQSLYTDIRSTMKQPMQPPRPRGASLQGPTPSYWQGPTITPSGPRTDAEMDE